MAANTAHLNGKERERYLLKTAIIGCDPYLLPPTVFCLLNLAKCLPQLTFPDIYIYLVHNPSPFTGESLKAFKSTDAYQYAVAGWVNDTKIWHVEKTHLHVITAKVNHSQALNSKPTSPWIVVQEDGTVPSTKMLKYDKVSNIFAIKEQVQTEDLFQHMRPSADDFKLFCEQLHQSEEQETKPKKSAILSVIEGHSHRYTPKTVQLDLQTPLTSLYQSSRLVLDLPALLEEGAKVFDELNLTPEQMGFTKRGHCQQVLPGAMQDHHEDINVAASGLILNPELPWIGASPDGVVTGACHEPGILEIKCPFSAKDRSLLECTKDSRFCPTVPEGELLGKWFTVPRFSPTATSDKTSEGH
ncbi:hypothetical protein JOQ06_030239 [Pogonophryne albipinna]|uniref:YqaJ viral recombinase domain-containing protein n=1 Tax=Pogonophryne albipinna TaxID=1090488 RepID=A0AAD6AXR3_9TELE|nr:hypothetical protein JOQ06_030239 [Pogonophryne albipinna]